MKRFPRTPSAGHHANVSRCERMRWRAGGLPWFFDNFDRYFEDKLATFAETRYETLADQGYG